MSKKSRTSLSSLTREMKFSKFFRPKPTAFSNANHLSHSQQYHLNHPQHNVLTNPQPRRESFLYRPTIIADHEHTHHIPYRSVSRASSYTSAEHQHGEDLIVTPFAQILASLRNVRANLIAIANISPDECHHRPIPRRQPLHCVALPDDVNQCAEDTLNELDWCLDQLETIQTHRSFSEMASSKFRKMLNKELSHFAESSKSGTQVSQFIIHTYLDKEDDDQQQETVGDEPSTSAASLADNRSNSTGILGKAKTAAMSRIGGIRKLRSYRGGEIPEFGVKGHKELGIHIQTLSEWGCDVFKIYELSDSHAITCVTYTILKNRGLLKTFEIAPSVLVTYLFHLEHHYRENPYHNQIHAADVVQSINVFLSSSALEDVFSDLEILSAIFASAIHDVDHPGFTNQFLINSNSELAIMYNDESVLEQHHLAVAFKLLQDSNCDFLIALTKKQRQTFRRLTIDLVLATDMSKHMSILANLKTMVEAKKVSGSSVLSLDKTDRLQVLQSMIHMADLSNPTKPIDIYRKWNQRIMEEYWGQGDHEKNLGLEVSPMCDRSNVSLEKSQVGFIDYIVHPLFETWAELVNPEAQPILDQLECNREWYQERIPEEQSLVENLCGETPVSDKF